MGKLWLFFLISGTVFGQQLTPRPKKILTPEQIVYQQKMRSYHAELQRLRDFATRASKTERAREKSGDCPKVMTTRDRNLCLSHEMDVTESNYKDFTAALRAILAFPAPNEPSSNERGPSGHLATSSENAAAFDAAESAWREYATAQCKAVDTFWRGGTIVGAMFGACRQRITRARLDELEDAYDVMLHQR